MASAQWWVDSLGDEGSGFVVIGVKDKITYREEKWSLRMEVLWKMSRTP